MPSTAASVTDRARLEFAAGSQLGAATEQAPAPAGALPQQERYNAAIGYLRAFVVLLVVAHHAVLAYHPFAPPPAASLSTQPQWWQVFPVADPQRWAGFALLVSFNDTFFMSLLFLVSGLFVWSSLQRKGPGRFARDRVVRLGMPFLIGAAVLAPLAYFPSYLQGAATPTPGGYWSEWLSLGTWPAGPVWFLWVLLAFDLAAATLTLAAPSWGARLGQWASRAGARPVRAFALLTAISAASYIPLAIAFGPLHWTSAGPFAVQTSRVLHYAVYFTAGIALGASGAWQGLLSPGGPLARRWAWWCAAAVLCFALSSGVTLASLARPESAARWAPAVGLGFVLSSAASSFWILAVFLRWTRRRTMPFDSLRASAYGIYLVHYAAVTWLQYALLGAPFPGLVKGAVVFLCAVAVSWAAAVLLRRVPAVGRVI